ncbi:MAG TPA: alpha/beta fold hydrolase, partial [Candidatus Nanopelagicales bacterium]|nr:alpha/beta fold hydrolase [Candidatus Nanopelagicales bacterium]
MTQLYREVSGAGPRVALIHGFTQNGRCWGPLSDTLARDHEVVRVDAPGHGRSAALDVGLWDAARLVGATCGAATYLGYSMGGRLCLHLALDRPDLVRALVLVGATP